MSATTTKERPQRIQRRRTRGWRMPPNTISVARPGRWGNPYKADVFGLDCALKLFDESVRGIWSPGTTEHLGPDLQTLAYELNIKFRARFMLHPQNEAEYDLRGKNLACYCPLDKRCHADVLLEIANPKGGAA